MDSAKAHIICTAVALLLISIASCLTYVLMSEQVRESQRRISILNESFFRPLESLKSEVSGKHWLLKAYSHTDSRLIWEDEWKDHRSQNNSILSDTDSAWIVTREKGVYLVYIQANFMLNPGKNSNSAVELKLQVYFDYGENTELFLASHRTQVVNENASPDATLSTFFLMYMNSSNQLSVNASPGDLVNVQPRPFSTFLTIIKWAEDW